MNKNLIRLNLAIKLFPLTILSTIIYQVRGPAVLKKKSFPRHIKQIDNKVIIESLIIGAGIIKVFQPERTKSLKEI
ncbi:MULTISPECIES: hypothetical protein [Sphingobacterium]|uniref:hypothetical protein n=1 Tax=Sphingobacterium TaxID=28453 RepID=UPI00257C472D|nr:MULTISPECIES: hypothetical protein [Sphingobacterium]